MASSLLALLSLALVACSLASPVPSDQVNQSTTPTLEEDTPLLEVIEVIDEVPVVVTLFDATTIAPETKETDHQVAKRSLRGDNPSNDLLADFEGLNYENGLSSFDGRRIKFLPTWLG